MFENLLIFAAVGIVISLRNQFQIASELRAARADVTALRAEVAGLRKHVTERGEANALLLGEAIEMHLDVPEERQIFVRAKS